MRLPHEFYAIIDITGNTPGSGGELTAEKIFDEFLKDDEKPKGDLLTSDDKKEKSEEEPELEEETEEKTEDEEELELEETPETEDNFEEVPRQAILKEYPELFKKFPQLEHAYYREKKYAELLPTLDDAKAAVDKSNAFDRLEASVSEGKLTDILGEVKRVNPDAFGTIVDNLLPNLQEVDKDAYYNVVGGVIKNVISAMAIKGQRSNSDQLKAAAVILNNFIFNSTDFEPHVNFGKKPTGDDEKLNNERQKFLQEKFDHALGDMTTRASNIIKSTISKHIDPKNSMTDYVKRIAVNNAVGEIENLIANDRRFRATLDKQWERVFDSNFARGSTETILKSYLSKARSLLQQVIVKHRNEALKGLGKRANNEREEPTKRGPVPRGRMSDDRGKVKTKDNGKPDIPNNVKTLDYLMED